MGGTIFETTDQTLTMNSEYFRSFLDEKWKREDGEIFIDRSPKAFEYILVHMRNYNYEVPKIYKDELDFYGVKYDEDQDLTYGEDQGLKNLPNLRSLYR